MRHGERRRIVRALGLSNPIKIRPWLTVSIDEFGHVVDVVDSLRTKWGFFSRESVARRYQRLDEEMLRHQTLLNFIDVQLSLLFMDYREIPKQFTVQ